MTVVSGGQTGVDRAAWDVALELGLTIGGWVPGGRRAEDGAIPARYSGLREADSTDPSVRTKLNVRDSDATLIISRGPLTGGSRLTFDEATRLGRPVLQVDLTSRSDTEAAAAVRAWLATIRPNVLNVAGPRASGDAAIGELAAAVLRNALGNSSNEGTAMNAQEILTTLRKLGKPQTAAIYKRYGTGDNVFGVLTSEIGKLQKKIKVDHTLAMELWKTKNAEARALALQIADPEKLSRTDADKLLKDGPVRFVGWYLSGLVARSPIADKTMRSWMGSREEYSREMGYSILASRLRDDPASISDADAEKVLATIEKEIHRSPNWARYAMNSALIAIGVAKPALSRKAIDTARRIGKVDVDHGETYCKTPDAAPYIEKTLKRKARA